MKIIPHSIAYISTAEEGGGGNRISEEQIKSYLENTLGEAPRPQWGCPGGWGNYLGCVPPLLGMSAAFPCSKCLHAESILHFHLPEPFCGLSPPPAL